MEKKHGEEKCNVDFCVSHEVWLKTGVQEQDNVEHNLDGVEEASSVEEISLIGLLHLELGFARLHESHIGCGVVAWGKLENLNLGTIFPNFNSAFWVNIDLGQLVSELSFSIVGGLILLHEHELLLPFGLLIVPGVELNSHLHKDDEM